MAQAAQYNFESFGAFVEKGLCPAVAAEGRALPLASARMHRFRADKPLPDPSVPEVTIHLLTAGELRYDADFSFGRFEGLKRPGEFDIAPPGIRGRFEGDGHFELLSLSLPWREVQRIAERAGCPSIDDFGPLHSRMLACPAVAHLMVQLWTEADPAEALGREFCEAALSTLILRLLRLAGVASTPKMRDPAKGGLAPWQVKRVQEHIENDLSGDLSVAALAELCSLSTFHFARAFHKSVGKPPHAYVTERRLAAAEQLLRETALEVTEIGPMVGYAEGGHLSRAFRKAKGFGPTEYRRRR